MTEQELREPPLLSPEEIKSFLKSKYPHMYRGNDNAWCRVREDALLLLLNNPDVELLLEARREADIKWMKEHCYLKAKRELPNNSKNPRYSSDSYHAQLSYKEAQQDMSKEVDGVSFKAVGKWV